MDPHKQSQIPPPVQHDGHAVPPPISGSAPPSIRIASAPLVRVVEQAEPIAVEPEFTPRRLRRRGRKVNRGRRRHRTMTDKRPARKAPAFSVAGYISSAVVGTAIGLALLRWFEVI